MLTNHIRNYPNMERAADTRGVYIGWDAAGRKYSIAKEAKRGWIARSVDASQPTISAATLYQVSERLAKRA